MIRKGNKMKYRIGIDLGGTNIAAGLVDENANIIRKCSIPTGASRAPEAIVDDMAALCHRLVNEQGISIDDVEFVGVATPGIADRDNGVVVYANNLPFRHLPISKMLQERFPVAKVGIDNDANAAAWGEAIAGAAKGSKTSVMITLGTGVGGGVVINGKLYAGFSNKGAELGHAECIYNLAYCYDWGVGIDYDAGKAIKLYKEAAELGLDVAQYDVAIYCFEEKDSAEAIKWLEKSAGQGYADAQYRLGKCYYDGEFVEKDLEKAVTYFASAAGQEHSDALCDLGYCIGLSMKDIRLCNPVFILAYILEP